MGKRNLAKEKTKRKNRQITITAYQKKQICEAIRLDVAQQVMILTCAYLMDEWDYDKDKICEVWDAINRYAGYIDTKQITLRKVVDIINEHTGLDLHWNKDN